MSRGKVMAALDPMVASGEVIQEEPPRTTTKDRLNVLRFRLKGLPGPNAGSEHAGEVLDRDAAQLDGAVAIAHVG